MLLIVDLGSHCWLLLRGQYAALICNLGKILVLVYHTPPHVKQVQWNRMTAYIDIEVIRICGIYNLKKFTGPFVWIHGTL